VFCVCSCVRARARVCVCMCVCVSDLNLLMKKDNLSILQWGHWKYHLQPGMVTVRQSYFTDHIYQYWVTWNFDTPGSLDGSEK
jgi:hypothetical protein